MALASWRLNTTGNGVQEQGPGAGSGRPQTEVTHIVTPPPPPQLSGGCGPKGKRIPLGRRKCSCQKWPGGEEWGVGRAAKGRYHPLHPLLTPSSAVLPPMTAPVQGDPLPGPTAELCGLELEAAAFLLCVDTLHPEGPGQCLV